MFVNIESKINVMKKEISMGRPFRPSMRSMIARTGMINGSVTEQTKLSITLSSEIGNHESIALINIKNITIERDRCIMFVKR